MWVTKGTRAQAIGDGLNRWEKQYGRPKVICSDAAQTNRSRMLKEWGDRRGVKLEFSPPFHHASLGFVERFN